MKAFGVASISRVNTGESNPNASASFIGRDSMRIHNGMSPTPSRCSILDSK